MSILTRGNLIKAFAGLLIIGFVVELFIVYTYSPSSTQDPAAVNNVPAPPQVTYLSASPAPFAIRSFTGSMLFTCNSSTSFPAFQGILGKPVQVGLSQGEKLFLARAINDSASDPAFVGNFSSQLASICTNVSLYREAAVSFNGSSVEVVNSLNPSDKAINITKFQLSSYTDRFGRPPVALISDANARIDDVVLLYLRVVMQGSNIVAGSLVLEQPTVTASAAVSSINSTT